MGKILVIAIIFSYFIVNLIDRRVTSCASITTDQQSFNPHLNLTMFNFTSTTVIFTLIFLGFIKYGNGFSLSPFEKFSFLEDIDESVLEL